MEELAALIDQLFSGDDIRAEYAVPEILDHGEAAITVLRPYLSSPLPDQRWWALRTISEIPSKLTPDLLLQSLDDSDPSVRHCAALGLRLHPEAGAIPRLIDALENQDRLFASLSGDALIAIGGAAVPGLIDVMENGNPPSRLEAVRALALIDDKRAIPVLFTALDDNSSLLEHWAGEGLERMGVGMTFFSPG